MNKHNFCVITAARANRLPFSFTLLGTYPPQAVYANLCQFWDLTVVWERSKGNYNYLPYWNGDTEKILNPWAEFISIVGGQYRNHLDYLVFAEQCLSSRLLWVRHCLHYSWVLQSLPLSWVLQWLPRSEIIPSYLKRESGTSKQEGKFNLEFHSPFRLQFAQHGFRLVVPIRESRYLSCCLWRRQRLGWGNTEDGGFVASIAVVGGNWKLCELAGFLRDGNGEMTRETREKEKSGWKRYLQVWNDDIVPRNNSGVVGSSL